MVWTPAILVHNSVFTSTNSTTGTVLNGSSITLISSGVPRTRQRIAVGPDGSLMTEKPPEVEAVVNLTRACNLAPITLRLGPVVCCLAVRLQFTLSRQHNVVTLCIEPLLRVANRTGQELLCKPVVTPILSGQLPLHVVSLIFFIIFHSKPLYSP